MYTESAIAQMGNDSGANSMSVGAKTAKTMHSIFELISLTSHTAKTNIAWMLSGIFNLRCLYFK